MDATVLTALATAGTLGVTHAIEPDHVAGISSVTDEGDGTRGGALVGVCFSLGHVALVVAWLAVAVLVLGRAEFSRTFHAVGTLGVSLVLGVLGAGMAVGGLRQVVRTDEHDHGDVTHRHPRVRLPLVGGGDHDHDHGVGTYLATGLVGALFTLSPPVSMIVFATALFPDHGAAVVALAVAAYAATITATMGLLGAGAGVLFDLARERGERLHAVARVVAGLAVAALAVTLLLDARPVV